MITVKDDKKQLTLSIDAYQYGNLSALPGEFDYDANWLDVAVSFCEGNEEKRRVDPCLLTTELRELTDAMEAVICKKEESYISDFLEPYLKIAFAHCNGQIAVIIHFVYDTDGTWKTWKINQLLNDVEARLILSELKTMCKEYPPR